jgi:hypothetical protein
MGFIKKEEKGFSVNEVGAKKKRMKNIKSFSQYPIKKPIKG